MCPLSCCRPASAAAIIALSVALASASPQRVKSQLQLALDAGVLEKTAEGSEIQRHPAFDNQWFSEDAQRIAQMPPYIPDGYTLAADGVTMKKRLLGKQCNPICTYNCGKKECDQTCKPLCLPPSCETLCSKAEDKCDTRCGKPKCAVICPTQHECADVHHCPKAKCRTICAPPVCTTSCSNSCHSVCTQPQCTWKCEQPDETKCTEPDCKMSCSTCDNDLFPKHNDRNKVPVLPGLDIKAEGTASLDPTVITEEVKAPPAPPPEIVPQSHKESSLGHDEVPVPNTTPSPVRQLKMRWKAEDLQSDNERLLRR